MRARIHRTQKGRHTMKWNSLLASAVLGLCVLTTNAAPIQKKPTAREFSADIKSARVKRKLSAKVENLVVNDIGDADSYGRPVRYLGLAQTSLLLFSPDCSSEPPEEGTTCVTLNASPAITSFTQSDLGRIVLPANAVNSLVCFALTPMVEFEFYNDTGTPQDEAHYIARARITVENEVLNDPTIVDSSGVPYNGSFITSLSTYSESRNLGVNERSEKNMSLSRNCIGGLVSKASLIDGLGLTEAQAAAFFAHPTTFRFGASGSLALVDFGSFVYGIRLYGD
jgi:hypothetical protein